MTMPMNGTGQIGPMGASLYVTIPGRPWCISIRRIDMDSDAAFAPFHAQPVTEAHLQALIPNWQHLNWTHHAPVLAGLPRESRATDGPYRVYLIYSDNNLQPGNLVDQFNADLA